MVLSFLSLSMQYFIAGAPVYVMSRVPYIYMSDMILQVPLYDMKEQMKKLSIRTEHVLKRETHLEEDVDFMNAQLQVMEEKLLTLLKLIQKGKREPQK